MKTTLDSIVEKLNKYGKCFDVSYGSVRLYGDDGMYDIIRVEEFGISWNGRIVDNEDFEKLLYWHR